MTYREAARELARRYAFGSLEMKCIDAIERALQSAHARGREEAIEEAAAICEAVYDEPRAIKKPARVAADKIRALRTKAPEENEG